MSNNIIQTTRLPPNAKEILKENSSQAKKRETQTIPWQEVEETLSKIIEKSSLTEVEIFKTIGLSPSSFYDGKREGKCRLVTKYALEGLLTKISPNQAFTFSELSLIFSSLISPNPDPETKALLKTLAKMLSS